MNKPSQAIDNRASVIYYEDNRGNQLYFQSYHETYTGVPTMMYQIKGTPFLAQAKLFSSRDWDQRSLQRILTYIEANGYKPTVIEVIAAI